MKKISLLITIFLIMLAESISSAELISSTEDKNPPNVLFLSPKKTTFQRCPLIIISYIDYETEVDINTIKFKVSDEDRTTDANITLSMLTYEPTTPLPYGINKIEITLFDVNKNMTVKQFTFVIHEEKITDRLDRMFDGGINLNWYYAKADTDEEKLMPYKLGSHNKLDLNLKSKIFGIELSCDVHLTSQQKYYPQCINKFVLSLHHKNIALNVGDNYLCYGELSLYDERVSGIGGSYKTKNGIKLECYFGENRRPQDVSTVGFEPVFKRDIYAYSISYEKDIGFLRGINLHYVDIKDDAGSIKDTNVVAPVRNKIKAAILNLRSGNLYCDSQFSMAKYRPDIRKNVSKHALAYLVSIGNDIEKLNTKMRFLYKYIEPDFVNLGNSIFRNDIARLEFNWEGGMIEDNIKYFITLARERDNILHRKITTMKRRELSLQTNLNLLSDRLFLQTRYQYLKEKSLLIDNTSKLITGLSAIKLGRQDITLSYMENRYKQLAAYYKSQIINGSYALALFSGNLMTALGLGYNATSDLWKDKKIELVIYDISGNIKFNKLNINVSTNLTDGLKDYNLRRWGYTAAMNYMLTSNMIANCALESINYRHNKDAFKEIVIRTGYSFEF